MNRYTSEEACQEKNDYEEDVEVCAQNVVDELQGLPKKSWNNQFTTLINERIGTHPRVIDAKLNILTLIYSDNPVAGIVNGTGPVRSSDFNHDSTSQFPFQAFAADAFAADVQEEALAKLKAVGVNINDLEYCGYDEDEEEEDRDDDHIAALKEDILRDQDHDQSMNA